MNGALADVSPVKRRISRIRIGVCSCCERVAEIRRGLCPKHYVRLLRYGDPLKTPARRRGGFSAKMPFTTTLWTRWLLDLNAHTYEPHREFRMQMHGIKVIA